MSLDSKGLPGRFFSLFPRYKQWEIAECLYPGEDGKKKQGQISNWRNGRESIPMDVLDRVVDLGLANWDWLLTGQGKSPFTPSNGERILSKQKPPATRAGDALFDEKIRAIMEACTTIDAALRQCLLEAATGKIPEDTALDLFGDIVAQIKEFHDKQRFADEEQATA